MLRAHRRKQREGKRLSQSFSLDVGVPEFSEPEVSTTAYTPTFRTARGEVVYTHHAASAPLGAVEPVAKVFYGGGAPVGVQRGVVILEHKKVATSTWKFNTHLEEGPLAKLNKWLSAKAQALDLDMSLDETELATLRIKLEQQLLEIKLRRLAVQASPSLPATATELATKPTFDFEKRAIERGESFLQSLVASGRLVGAMDLAKAWHSTRAGLDYKRNAGKLIGLKYKGDWFYPTEFASLQAEDVATVCGALGGEDTVGKYLALQEKQPALGGQTILDAIRNGDVLRARSLALAWSEERGLTPTDAATPRRSAKTGA